MVNQEVIDKLSKILALASDTAATAGEVEAAIGKAKEIALRYGVSLASVPDGRESKKGPALKVETNNSLKPKTRFKHAYHDPIFAVLQQVFGVRILTSKHREHSSTHISISAIWIIGEETDVALCLAVYPWLERHLPRLFTVAIKERRVAGRDRSSQNGFFWGLANGIVAVNKREEAKLNKDESACWALVVQSKEDLIAAKMAADFPHVKDAKSTKLRMDWTAHQEGRKDGEKINLRQAGPGGKQERIG